jgi:hypothetical protein
MHLQNLSPVSFIGFVILRGKPVLVLLNEVTKSDKYYHGCMHVMHGSVGLLTSAPLASSSQRLALVVTYGSHEREAPLNWAIQYSIYTRHHGKNLILFRLVFQNLYKHGQVYYTGPSPNKGSIYSSHLPSLRFSALLYSILPSLS